MPVLVREVDDIEWIVEWKAQMKESQGISVETLLLDRFPECKPNLTLTCTYGELIQLPWHLGSCRSVHLCLAQTEGPTAQDTEELCRHYKPLSVSVHFDGSQWHDMRHEDGLNEAKWVYDAPALSFARGRDASLLRCVFSIKFKTFGVSEMVEALKHVTDYLFLQQSHCDVKFCFRNDEQPLGGHVKILSSRSSVFATMFQQDMQESKTSEVFIRDTERDVFYQLLHYIYSGRLLTSLTECVAQKLLLAADKYNVTGLSTECTSYLISNIQWDRAVDLMIWAHVHSIGQVKEAALDVVAKNGKQISSLDAWKDLTINYPHLCLEVTRRMNA